MKKTSIVILGGGFAGLSAATYLDKTLARRADAESDADQPSCEVCRSRGAGN